MGVFKFVMDKDKALLGQGEPAETIKKEVEALGLSEDLGGDWRVEVEGGKVKLKGAAPDRAMREKAILAAGDVNRIAEVEEAIEAPGAVVYEVKSGDTLCKIAKAHHGDAMKHPAIFEADKPMLKEPDLIYPGQRLRSRRQGVTRQARQ